MTEYCVKCRKRHSHYSWVNRNYVVNGVKKSGWFCGESTQIVLIDALSDQRRTHKKDTVQPFRSGELSKEFVDLHGTEGINVSDKEAKSAKRVWFDTPGWRNKDLDCPYTK